MSSPSEENHPDKRDSLISAAFESGGQPNELKVSPKAYKKLKDHASEENLRERLLDAADQACPKCKGKGYTMSSAVPGYATKNCDYCKASGSNPDRLTEVAKEHAQQEVKRFAERVKDWGRKPAERKNPIPADSDFFRFVDEELENHRED